MRVWAAGLLGWCAAAGLLASCAHAQTNQRPSFLQTGEAFCTDQTDFDGYVQRHGLRLNSGRETCVVVNAPTRVAVVQGNSGGKSLVRIMAGPYAYAIGWTNGQLP